MSDYERYRELITLIQCTNGHCLGERGDKMRVEAWAEIEAIKNRHGGMPPKADE